MNVLLSLPRGDYQARHIACVCEWYLYADMASACSVIASSLALFAFDDHNTNEMSSRPSAASHAGELVTGQIHGSLTTHISMDTACVPVPPPLRMLFPRARLTWVLVNTER